MTKRVLFGWLLLLLGPTVMPSQTVPSGEPTIRSLWIGGEVSTFNPDWGCRTTNSPFSCWNNQLLGAAAFSDANRIFGRVGTEAEARWMNWRGYGDGLVESSYLLGPRFQAFAHRDLSGNIKILFGRGDITAPDHVGTGTYFVYAPGATLDYRVRNRLNMRLDYEYQRWPSFTGVLGTYGLTPNGFSLGVGYRVGQ